MRPAVRGLLWIALSSGFTLAIIQYSLRHGRLILPPTYDDVAYFADGLARLEVLYRDGLAGLGANYLQDPPHSPFSTYLALVSFALFGVHDWAPYACNLILVFVLLAFVDHMLREQPWWARVMAALLSLTVPFAGEAVAEFRPDIACGLLTAMGVIEVLDRPPSASSIARRGVAGACFGLALLFKPAIFPMTLAMLGLALAVACYSDRAHRPRRASGGWTYWRPLVWPIALLGLPQFLFTGNHYLSYFRTALLAPTKPIPDFQGTLTEKLSFYAVGAGGDVMLGSHLYLLAGVVVVAGALLVARRRTDALQPLRNQLLPLALAYSIPTLNPVKQPFFGVTFAILLFLLAIQAIRAVLEARSRPADTRWAAAGIVAVVAIAAALAKPPPSWGTLSDPAVQRRKELAERIFGSIREACPAASARVYWTTRGYLNAELLRYMALKSGFTGWRYGTFDDSSDLALYERELALSDFVLASETGNNEVSPYLTSTRLQDQTLARVRSDPDFVQRAAFPTLTGKSYFLFERIGPFFGWSSTEGVLGLEGPYPQWHLPLVRWGCGPRSALTARADLGGPVTLRLSGRSALPGQEITIRLDGVELERRPLGSDTFERVEISLTLAPGPHRLQLDYTAWEKTPGAPTRAVLFDLLQLSPQR